MLKISRKSPVRTVRSLCGGDSGKPPGAACSTPRRLPSEARGLMRLCAACTRSAPSPFSSRRNAAVKRTRRKHPPSVRLSAPGPYRLFVVPPDDGNDTPFSRNARSFRHLVAEAAFPAIIPSKKRFPGGKELHALLLSESGSFRCGFPTGEADGAGGQTGRLRARRKTPLLAPVQARPTRSLRTTGTAEKARSPVCRATGAAKTGPAPALALFVVCPDEGAFSNRQHEHGAAAAPPPDGRRSAGNAGREKPEPLPSARQKVSCEVRAMRSSCRSRLKSTK